MSIELRMADDRLAKLCFQLLKDLYQDNYYGVSDKFLKWKYSTPFHSLLVRKNEHPIMVATENDAVLAFEVFLPMATVISGKLVPTVWTTEWLNNSKIPGLGKKVFSAVRERVDLKCFYGANTFSKKSCEKDGLLMRDHIERMLAILNPEKCSDLFSQKALEKADFISSHACPKITSGKHFVAETCVNFSENYWDDAQTRFSAISYRGLDYLKWRYVDSPGFAYNFISLDRKAEHGLAIVRIEKIKHRQERVLRILDMLPVRGFELELTQAVLKFGFEQGVILADFFCSSSDYAKALMPQYFLPLVEHIECDIPMLFQPIEVRDRKSINMVLDSSRCSTSLSFENFYTTKADAEQDVQLNDDYSTPIV